MANNEIYYAPIIIEDEEQFGTLGISKEDCEYKRIGPKKVQVYQVQASREVSTFLSNSYRAEFRSEVRSQRCMVPGKHKPLILCPLKNKCSACPYVKVPNTIALDEEVEDINCYEMQTDDYQEVDAIMRLLYRKNPVFPTIVEKLADGWKPSQIAQYLGISGRQLTYYRDVIKAIGKEYRLSQL